MEWLEENSSLKYPFSPELPDNFLTLANAIVDARISYAGHTIGPVLMTSLSLTIDGWNVITNAAITIKFADGQSFVSSASGTTKTITVGTTYTTICWINNLVSTYITLIVHNANALLVSSWPVTSASSIAFVGSTVTPVVGTVLAMQIGATEVTGGTVIFEEGRNCKLTEANGVQIDFIPGEGSGKVPASYTPDPAIYTINGIGPDKLGNFTLSASDCLLLRGDPANGRIYIQPMCKACSACSDYYDVYAKIGKLLNYGYSGLYQSLATAGYWNNVGGEALFTLKNDREDVSIKNIVTGIEGFAASLQIVVTNNLPFDITLEDIEVTLDFYLTDAYPVLWIPQVCTASPNDAMAKMYKEGTYVGELAITCSGTDREVWSLEDSALIYPAPSLTLPTKDMVIGTGGYLMFEFPLHAVNKNQNQEAVQIGVYSQSSYTSDTSGMDYILPFETAKESSVIASELAYALMMPFTEKS